MPNVLINPNSGILEFSTGISTSSTFQNLSGAARITFDGIGGLSLTSYATGFVGSGLDRFSVDGANGRLFAVTDTFSGSIFSVNDIAGLPIIEAFDDNTVIMGAFNRNDFVLTGNSLGLGGLPNTGTTKLYVSGNTLMSGNLNVSGKITNTGIADIFPASQTRRRYPPEGLATTTSSSNMLSGHFQYFPFLIKKDVVNPKICVEVAVVGTTDTPIRYGIYSGDNGFEGAKLFHSGSINALNAVGVYTGDINTTLIKGPYIIATSNTGVSAGYPTFRVFGVSSIRNNFGDPTGNSTLFGAAFGTTTHYYETGVDLPTIIGSGLAAGVPVAPLPALIY